MFFVPKAKTEPIVNILGYFEAAPLSEIKLAGAMVKETIRRRFAGETVLTEQGPRIDPPPVRRKKKDQGAAPAAPLADPAGPGN